MAITTRSNATQPSGWSVTAHTADASGTEELVATPGSGKALYLQYAILTSVAAITMTLGEGESGSRPEQRIFGPVNFAAGSGSPITFNPPKAVKLTDNKSLTLYGGAGAIQVFVQGYTE